MKKVFFVCALLLTNSIAFAEVDIQVSYDAIGANAGKLHITIDETVPGALTELFTALKAAGLPTKKDAGGWGEQVYLKTPNDVLTAFVTLISASSSVRHERGSVEFYINPSDLSHLYAFKHPTVPSQITLRGESARILIEKFRAVRFTEFLHPVGTDIVSPSKMIRCFETFDPSVIPQTNCQFSFSR